MVVGRQARCVSLIATLCVGTQPTVAAAHRTGKQPISANSSTQEYTERYKACVADLLAGRYRNALTCYRAGADLAAARHDDKYRLVFLTGAGSALSASYRYRDAIRTFNSASALAREVGWMEYVAINAAMLSSVYLRLGHYDLAYSEASHGLAALSDGKGPNTRAQLLVAMAEVKYLTGDKSEGLRLFGLGLDEAKRAQQHSVVADALNRMGRTMLERGDISDAEPMLTESLDIRRSRNLAGVDACYRNLGMLRLLQRKPESALEYFDQALSAARHGGSRVPMWAIYFGRGDALRMAGKLHPALEALQTSVDEIRRRRDDIVPVEEILTTADVKYQLVYSAYIETAMVLAEQNHDPELVAKAFTASEENRAGSVRQTRSWRERLPERYWDVLAEARTLEVAGVSSPASSPDPRLQSLNAELGRMEAAAGLELPQENSENTRGDRTLINIRQSLRPGEALLSFHLGTDQSYLWTLSRGGLDVRRLPSRRDLADRIAAFRAAVEANGAGLNQSAEQLYAVLFPELPQPIRAAREWVLSLDDTLFELPLAALRDGRQYLVERHALRIVPSAHMLRRRAPQVRNGAFVAIADPVYNRADSRWRGTAKPAQARSHGWFARLFETREAEPTPAMELARIPASAAEARECAQTWTAGRTTVLTGTDANRARLAEELSQRPAIAHFSVHVIAPEASQQHAAYIALGLQADGKPDLLTPAEISRRELGVPLVVLSGCSSGRGRALPGAGLTGLTRAWLLSGSYAVAASHWPTPDDTGALFRSFYRSLRSRFPVIDAKTSAEALRQAQMEMLRSGTWRSEPRYWAAFFLVGRN